MSKKPDEKPMSETPIRRRGFLGALAAIPAAFHLASVVRGEQPPPTSPPSDIDWEDNEEETSSDSSSSSESSSWYWSNGGDGPVG